MKFTINRDEIELMVRNQYNLPANCEIAFDSDSSLHDKIVAAFVNLPERQDNKIARIKALRQLFMDFYSGSLGLAEAKDTIENWNNFLEFVKQNNRWPVVTRMPTHLPGGGFRITFT